MPKIKLSWTTDGKARRKTSKYLIYRSFDDGDTWVKIGETGKKEYTINKIPTGKKCNFAVAVQGINGRITPITKRRTVSKRIKPKITIPDNISGFTGVQDGVLVYLTWNKLSPMPQDFDCYEIREGTTWNNSTRVYRASTEFAKFSWKTTGSRTYLIKVIDHGGTYSNTAASVVINVLDDNLFVEQAEHDESATWPGTKDNLTTSGTDISLATKFTDNLIFSASTTDIFVASTIYIGADKYLEGSYTTPAKDSGVIGLHRLNIEGEVSRTLWEPEIHELQDHRIGGERWREGEYVTQPDAISYARNTEIGGNDTPIDIKYEIQLSITDVASAASVSWGNWQVYLPGEYHFRWVRIRMLILNPVGFGTTLNRNFKWQVKNRNKKDEGKGVAAGGATSITFVAPFLFAPSLVGNYEADLACYVVFYNVTKTGADAKVYDNDGAQKTSGDFSWVAAGA